MDEELWTFVPNKKGKHVIGLHMERKSIGNTITEGISLQPKQYIISETDGINSKEDLFDLPTQSQKYLELITWLQLLCYITNTLCNSEELSKVNFFGSTKCILDGEIIASQFLVKMRIHTIINMRLN